MKWIVVFFLIIGIRMMQDQQKETAPFQFEHAITVSWLRDGQTAMKNAELKKGSFFIAKRTTVYGADCVGCTLQGGVASTSAQIEVTTDSIRQSDGTWKKGITYDGYYLIAADEQLPLCAVVRISGHSYSGAGIEVNVPFYAIVADRGSRVQNEAVDLFSGSEMNPLVRHENLSGAVIELVDFLNYKENENGQMGCTAD